MIAPIAALLSRVLPLWRPLAIGVLVVVTLAGVYAKGRNDSTRAWEAKEAERQLAEAKRRVALQAQVDQLAGELEAARAARQVVTRTITREVPRYVREPAPACADSGLHAPGWRVLHDAAAAGVAPDTARLADAAAVPAAVTADTVTANYAGCHSAADQVEGWQRWWATVTAK